MAAFLFWNWVELVAFVWIYMKIENVKDELNIQKELKYIIYAWLGFSIIYFFCNTLLKMFDAQKRVFLWIIFFAILFRDLAAIIIQAIYCKITYDKEI